MKNSRKRLPIIDPSPLITDELPVRAEIDADELLRAFDVSKSVGDSWIAPGGPADDLSARFELESLRIGFGELQLAVVGKNEKVIAEANDRAGANLGLFPEQFAG